MKQLFGRVSRQWALAVGMLAASAGLASAAPPIVTDAHVSAGLLTVVGTATPGASITLDGRFIRTVPPSGNFAYNLSTYLPSDCIVAIAEGVDLTTAVVANCGPRGVTPRGNWVATTTYTTDDLVYHGGSTFRAAKNEHWRAATIVARRLALVRARRPAGRRRRSRRDWTDGRDRS